MTRGLALLWVRAALRRPLRAVALVVALVAISTTTVAGLVAADGLSGMFARDARAEWPGVDVEGHSSRGSVFDDFLARYLIDKAGPGVTAAAPRLVLPAAVGAHSRTVQGLALGLGAEEQGFAPMVARTGAADAAALGAQDALLNERLARRLHVGVGDPITVLVAVPEWLESRSTLETQLTHRSRNVRLDVRVAGVLEDRSTADLHRTPNVVLSRSVLQQATGLVTKSNVIDFQLKQAGRPAAKAFILALDPDARRTGVVLQPVKEDALDTAAGEGGLFRSILLTLAVLVVASALGGTVQLVVALVRERTPEVAYLRAAGAPRSLLGRLVVVETLVYAAVAAVVGGVLAMPAAAGLAGALADHLAALDAGRGRETARLQTTVRPGTVVLGVFVVLVVAVLAARSAARRALAAEPEALLRGELADAPTHATGSRRPVVLLAVGMLLTGAAAGGVAALLYLGLTLVLASWWVWARRSRLASPDRRAAVLGLVWSVAGAAGLGAFSQGVQAGFGVITVAGLVAVACACVLVTPHLRRLARGVRTYAPRGPAQLALLSAGARAERYRGRSGLAAGVVGAGFFGVVAVSVLGSTAALPVSRQDGGFTVYGTSVAGVDAARLAAAAPAARTVIAVPHAQLPERAYRTEDAAGKRGTVPYPVRLVADEAELVRQQRWGLAASLPQYRTATEALTAVITDGDKAVVDRYTRPEGAKPGDDVVIDLGGTPRRFTLVAVLDTFLLGGVVISDSSFRDTGLAHGRTLVLASGGPGTVEQLRRAGEPAGLDVESAQHRADQVVKANRAFTDVFAVVLVLALAIALTSAAAGVVRTGRERRGELGVLRALGLARRHVLLELTGEPLLSTAVGLVVGGAVGVAVLRALFAVGYSDLPFVLPVGRIVAVAALTVVVAVVACAVAALPASRVPTETALADLG